MLAGKPLAADRALFFSHEQGRGVRRGPWKASKRNRRDWELFNLDADPGETHDLSAEQPETLDSLVRELDNWDRTVRADRQRRISASKAAANPQTATSAQ
jgi:arylsulfatase A-like enzyme